LARAQSNKTPTPTTTTTTNGGEATTRRNATQRNGRTNADASAGPHPISRLRCVLDSTHLTIHHSLLSQIPSTPSTGVRDRSCVVRLPRDRAVALYSSLPTWSPLGGITSHYTTLHSTPLRLSPFLPRPVSFPLFFAVHHASPTCRCVIPCPIPSYAAPPAPPRLLSCVVLCRVVSCRVVPCRPRRPPFVPHSSCPVHTAA
jgi:hypothetical protein